MDAAAVLAASRRQSGGGRMRTPSTRPIVPWLALPTAGSSELPLTPHRSSRSRGQQLSPRLRHPPDTPRAAAQPTLSPRVSPRGPVISNSRTPSTPRQGSAQRGANSSPRFGTPNSVSNGARRRGESQSRNSQTDGSQLAEQSSSSGIRSRRPNPLLSGRASIQARPSLHRTPRAGSLGRRNQHAAGSGVATSPSVVDLDSTQLESVVTPGQQIEGAAHWEPITAATAAVGKGHHSSRGNKNTEQGTARGSVGRGAGLQQRANPLIRGTDPSQAFERSHGTIAEFSPRRNNRLTGHSQSLDGKAWERSHSTIAELSPRRGTRLTNQSQSADGKAWERNHSTIAELSPRRGTRLTNQSQSLDGKAFERSTIGESSPGRRARLTQHSQSMVELSPRRMPRMTGYRASTSPQSILRDQSVVRESSVTSDQRTFTERDQCSHLVEFEGVDLEFESESFIGSTCDKVEALCGKAQHLIYEISACVAPQVAAQPPGVMSTRQHLPVGKPPKPRSPIPGHAGEPSAASPSICSAPPITPICGMTSPAVGSNADEELANLRFRIVRLELELDRAHTANHPMTPSDDIITLRKQVEMTQAQLKEAVHEMNEAKGQLTALTHLMKIGPTAGPAPSPRWGGGNSGPTPEVEKSSTVLAQQAGVPWAPQGNPPPRLPAIRLSDETSAQSRDSMRSQCSTRHSSDAFVSARDSSKALQGQENPLPIQAIPVRSERSTVDTATSDPPATVRLYETSLHRERRVEGKDENDVPLSELVVMLMRLSERQPLRLRAILDTAASASVQEFLQECLKGPQGEAMKAHQQELWFKLGKDQRQKLKAQVLAAVQQEGQSAKLNAEDSISRSGFKLKPLAAVFQQPPAPGAVQQGQQKPGVPSQGLRPVHVQVPVAVEAVTPWPEPCKVVAPPVPRVMEPRALEPVYSWSGPLRGSRTPMWGGGAMMR